jgi:hypothetical protein
MLATVLYKSFNSLWFFAQGSVCIFSKRTCIFLEMFEADSRRRFNSEKCADEQVW